MTESEISEAFERLKSVAWDPRTGEAGLASLLATLDEFDGDEQ
jgi:hypothetical protein